jgi:hypothetical protein
MKSFKAVILVDGLNAFIQVPKGLVRAAAPLAEKRRIRVAGRIDGHPFSAMIVPARDGRDRLYVNGGMRARADVDVGDRVAIELHPIHTEEVVIPADVQDALARADLKQRFEALSPTHRRELIRFVDDARSAKNRLRRIEGTLSHLHGERTQRPKPASIDKPLWMCPKCGHPFVSRNMNHSCTRYELDDLFRGKPGYVRALFDRFQALIDERGPTTTIVYRDRVGFMVKVRFAGVTPRRDHIEAAFWFTERDEDPRFSKIETIACASGSIEHTGSDVASTCGRLQHPGQYAEAPSCSDAR